MLNIEYELSLLDSGYACLGAIDEAGRGPLAGPVVAACVVIDSDFKLAKELAEVKDSKKLSEKKREALFDIISSEFSGVGIGICDHKTVDRINILQASFLAMKKAIGALRKKPEMIILDGKFSIPNLSIKQEPIIKGDARIFSIAAASIIAKVTRDRLMRKYHTQHPLYGFDQHKGYGTKQHMESLRKHGPCVIHRRSFGPVSRHRTKNIEQRA
ncbi:ribonuclease HII [Candidatus Parcubacteria bacterium]|nr:ribonuclease HII [Candidatus Parcubacteria bacterium]